MKFMKIGKAFRRLRTCFHHAKQTNGCRNGRKSAASWSRKPEGDKQPRDDAFHSHLILSSRKRTKLCFKLILIVLTRDCEQRVSCGFSFIHWDTLNLSLLSLINETINMEIEFPHRHHSPIFSSIRMQLICVSLFSLFRLPLVYLRSRFRLSNRFPGSVSSRTEIDCFSKGFEIKKLRSPLSAPQMCNS